METIQYYDHIKQELIHPQKTKILKILQHGCLKKVNTDSWICRPIINYNKTVYTLFRTPDGGWRCQCQGWKKHGRCSHSKALELTLNETQKQGTFF